MVGRFEVEASSFLPRPVKKPLLPETFPVWLRRFFRLRKGSLLFSHQNSHRSKPSPPAVRFLPRPPVEAPRGPRVPPGPAGVAGPRGPAVVGPAGPGVAGPPGLDGGVVSPGPPRFGGTVSPGTRSWPPCPNHTSWRRKHNAPTTDSSKTVFFMCASLQSTKKQDYQ